MSDSRTAVSRYVWAMGGLLLLAALFVGVRPAPDSPPARGTITIEEVASSPSSKGGRQLNTKDPVRKPIPVSARPRPRKPAPRPAPKPPAEPAVVVNDTTLRKSYSADGVTLLSPTGLLTLGLKDIRIGGRPLPAGALVQDVAPRSEKSAEGEVVYSRGAVVEKYVPRGEGIEQIFVLNPTLEPLRGGGDLLISVALQTALEAALVTKESAEKRAGPADAVEFKRSDGGVAFRYGAATAIDANGRRERLAYGLRPGILDMTLRASFLSTAAFPLTIDPLIDATLTIDFTSSIDQEPDVAFSATDNSWLVVWERNVTTSNGDICIRPISSTGIVSGTGYILDTSTSIDARNPKVARSNSNQFLVVWQEKGPGGSAKYQIYGQFVTVTGNVPTLPGSKFLIHSVPLQDATNPDVGWNTVNNRYVVAWEETISSDSDIKARTVFTSGSTSAAFQVANTGGFEHKPTVVPVSSNSVNGIAWVRSSVAGAQGDIYTCSFDAGTASVTGPTTAVSTNFNDETNPSLGGSSSSLTNFLAWTRLIAGSGANTMAVRVQYFGSGPTVSTNTFPVELNPNINTLRPNVDVATSGGENRLIVTYSQNTHPVAVDGWNPQAKIFNFNADPPTVTESLQIWALQKDDDFVRVAVNPAGMMALAVFDNLYEFSTTDKDMYAQRISLLPVAGFLIAPTTTLTTDEGGAQDGFTVALTKAPTSNVTITLTTSDPNEGSVSPPSLTFNTANWSIPQPVTVTGVNDFLIDGDITYSVVTGAATSGDPAYSGLNPPDVLVDNRDDDFADILVTPTSLTTTEDGDVVTFDVVLNSIPDDDVFIDLFVDLPSEIDVISGLQLFFPRAAALTPQPVQVKGLDDFIVDGDQTARISLIASSFFDFNYDQLPGPDVFVTNRDNDVASIVVTPTSGLITTEAGGTATFNVFLTAQPTNNVGFTLFSSVPGEGTLSLTNLVFTPTTNQPVVSGTGGWNMSHQVIVTGVNDLVADGPKPYVIVTNVASSADSNYNGFDPADVSVTNQDNDVANIIVSPTSGLITNEGGLTAQFTVVLTSQPTANVTIGLSSSNTGEGTVTPTTLTFTPTTNEPYSGVTGSGGWNVVHTVNVTGANDLVADGPKLYTIVTAAAGSTDPGYSGRESSDVTVTNQDNDTAGILVSPGGGLTTSETPTQAGFTIRLQSQPTANVTIDLSSSDTTEGTVSPLSVTFTTGNWDQNQPVTVTGVDDALADGPIGFQIVTAPANSSDSVYNLMNAIDVGVTNNDNDTANVTVSAISGPTSESGGPATFSVVLTSQPLVNVTISLTSLTPGEGNPSLGSLTFTPTAGQPVSGGVGGWNVLHFVTVTGADDLVDDGNVVYTIQTGDCQAVGDSNYHLRVVPDVTVTNIDDDTAGVTVSAISGPTSEPNGTATFTVVLTSQPLVNVVITLSSSDPGEGNPSPTTLTFTPTFNQTVVGGSGGWNVPHTVTVTGADDAVVDGNVAYTIQTSDCSASGDPNYHLRVVSEVPVTNNDNDSVGVTVSAISGPTAEPNGTATFTVVLTSEPLVNVVITLSSSNTNEGTPSPATLTFTPTFNQPVVGGSGGWNVLHTVTVTGVDDFIDDGNISYTIVTSACDAPGDPNYNFRVVADVPVTNNDNDTAAVNLNVISSTTSEAGGQGTLTLVLASQPTSNVTIGVSSNNTSEGSVSPGSLTFTASGNPVYNPVTGVGDWNVPHVVTVTGVDDLVDDGNVAYTIVTTNASSTDPNYSARPVPDSVFINNDDDIAGVTVVPPATPTTEAGGQTTFSIRLDTQPIGNVTITLPTLDTTEGSISLSTLVFTPTTGEPVVAGTGGWNVPHVVTVTGVDDFIDDGDITYIIVTTLSSAPSDPPYVGMAVADVPVTNNDNDTANVLVTPTTGLVTSESGGQATYSIVLTSQPTATVTIPLISSSNTAEGTVAPASLVFTVNTGEAMVGNTGGWNVPHIVTLTGVDDAGAADGPVGYTISHQAMTGAGSGYAGFVVPPVSATNNDNDQQGVTVSLISGPTTEAGGPATFTVRLNSQPTQNVTIDLSSNNTNEGQVSLGQLVFTPTSLEPVVGGTGGWDVLHVVTVIGQNDDFADGPVTYAIVTTDTVSLDSSYNGLVVADVTVVNNDNDTAGVSVSAISGPTTEGGGPATFSVVLTSRPVGNVSITVTSLDTTEGTVPPATTLVFTTTTGAPMVGNTGGWNVPHFVTVTPVEDFVADGPIVYTIQTTAASAPSDLTTYDGMAVADVLVTNNDNDNAGIAVSLINQATTEGGGTGTFTVVLTSQPTSNVTIAISSSDGSEGNPTQSLLTFTPVGGQAYDSGTGSGGWDMLHTVTVTGVDDLIADGNVAYTIVTGAAVSADPNYSGRASTDVAVLNNDNDNAAINVTAISGATTEAGGSATFSVVLTSQPTADVTISLTSSNPAEGSLTLTSLTFTASGNPTYSPATGVGDWNVPHIVTVTGVEDAIDDGNIGFTIQTGAAAAGTDPNYNGMAVADVAVTNNDDDTFGVTVSAISGPTTEPAGTATFTVRLSSQPTTNVTIVLSTLDATEGAPQQTLLTFTQTAGEGYVPATGVGGWDVLHVVTVVGANDFVADGPIVYTIQTSPASAPGDPNYHNLAIPDVTVTNNDDDVAGVTVSAISGPTTEAAGTATFSIRLTSEPTADVTISITSLDTTEGTVPPTILTFTPSGNPVYNPGTGFGNWDVLHVVTVTGVNDFVVDGDVGYTIQTGPAVGGDYAGMAVADVAVTNTDDDVAGITVNAISGPTSEGGGTATFTVRLTSEPTANVTIALSSSNTSEGTVAPSTLTFTPTGGEAYVAGSGVGGWDVLHTVTVTGVNDSVVDGPVVFTITTAAAGGTDLTYAGMDAADVAVTNTDNDVAGITVSSPGGLVTTEAGGQANFTIRLNTQPSADVTIALSSSVPGEGTVSPASLTFTSFNWDTPQPVTATGVDDFVDDGDRPYSIVTAPATSADSNYNGVDAANVTATNTDNDTAGFTITPTAGLVTTEAGGQATFTVRLNSAPTAPVTLSLTSGDPSEGTVLPASVAFDATDWDTPKTVTITGVEDFVVDGNIGYSILTGPATSTDPNYGGVDPSNVTVTNNDNDIAGFSVTPTTGLTTNESGNQATFNVVLGSLPSADVVVALTSTNTNEGTVSLSTLTFTGTSGQPYNPATGVGGWDVPHVVTVTGVNDTLIDGDIVYTVVLSQAVSSDPFYNNVNPADVAVTNHDNDTAEVIVTPTTGLTTTEAGGTATFTVVLKSTPSATVTINLSTSPPGEGTVSPTVLTFTPGIALTPQTVLVTGVDDTKVDGNVSYSVVTSTAVSTDTNYSGLTVPDVLVTNTDDDVANILVNPVAGLQTTEAGGTATFTIVLTSTPDVDVTIALSSSNTNEGNASPPSVTFTPANALTPQTVTVTGANDFMVDGIATYTIQTAAAVSGDSDYAGIDPADVTVTNADDDVVGFTFTPASGLFTNEYGKTAILNVRLNTIPTGNVTINFTSSNTGEGTVSPGFLTFTPGNALTDQPVTVTGVDDALADGNVLYSIVTAPAASTDTDYDTLNPADIPATNLDNESPAITVSPTSGLLTSETGGTDTFDVMLNTIPSANVTVGLSTSNPTEGIMSPTSLTFTATSGQAYNPATGVGGWDVPHVVTVTGVNDALSDGDTGYTIILASASSSDGSYNGVNPTDVTVTNIDDEPFVPPRISLSAISMTFSATEGGSIPPSQSMSVSNSGTGTLNWSVSSPAPWLNAAPTGGSLATGAQTFMTVSVDPAGLTAGTYTTQITVSDPAASNNPQTVDVSFTVLPPPPTVAITTPNVDPFMTASGPLLISGTSSVGATSVTWSNAATGESGSASGTDSWIASIPLLGGTNFITIYSWNAGGAGSTTLTVNFVTDAIAPTLAITFPSPNPQFNVGTTPVTLAGSASDDTAVTRVEWVNLTMGTGGLATGTTAWITSIPLVGGDNSIRVLAKDAAGNQFSQNVIIHYTSPPDAGLPTIGIVVPTTLPTFAATSTPLFMGGIAADSVGVARVTWWNATTGGRGVAAGTASWSAFVPLAGGGNFISVTAEDPSGNMATAILLVSFQPAPGDNVNPFLAITTPTTLPTLATGTPAILVAGMAADDVELNTVVWENPAVSQSGTTNGLGTWSAQMTLAQGFNPVALTAYDTSGNKTTKQLNVTYTPPPPPPPPPVHIPAGHCGLTGLDALLSLGLLFALRRGTRRLRREGRP